MQTRTLAAAIVIPLGLAAYWLLSSPAPMPGHTQGDAVAADVAGTALVTISLPETLSENAQIGKRIFDATCAACHAENAVGQRGVAPPLIHKTYEPSHHGDEAFQRAVALGVQSHHWPFGDMPPVDGLTRGDVEMVISYIREVQRANGIN